ncbi:MAG: MBL fold metallo-hydrolase [Austwickia sp.]|jgi:L-ascorbate metabolism protein UlaG (beta-lactamase superfamily)|nr:MAG: MBL fold metallo-hydrolase [Austwickia sp.]
MIVTQLGHSCLLVEVADVRILIDPGGFTPAFEEVRDLDAVFVTHQHPDHCDVERLPALLRGNPQARVLVEPQTAAQLGERGMDVDDLASGREFTIGGLTVETVGEMHAVIHADIPRICNVGVVLRADGEPVLFHPGDAIDADPGRVDVLAVPINAPWCAMKETIEFVRRVGPGRFVPIHDGLLQPRGRSVYLGQIDNLTGPDVRLVDLADGTPAALT